MNTLRIKALWLQPRVRIGIIVAFVIVLLVVLSITLGGRDKIDLDEVRTCKAERGDLVVSILQSGELMAKHSRDILNEAYHPAKIVEIVEDGAYVTNGQLLVELESSQLEERYLDQLSDVAEAEASLKLAQDQLEITKLKASNDLETARLRVELAKMDLQKYEEVEYTQMVDKATSDIYLAEQELKKARNDLAGTRTLYEKGYANKAELEADELGVVRKEIEVKNKTKDLYILKEYTSVKRRMELINAVKNAESAYERLKRSTKAEIESKQAAIESKKTRLEIERNQLKTRETQLKNTKIYADFNGQVFYPKTNSRRYRGSNEAIEKGASVNYRQKILSFPDLSAWDIRVGIPEAMIDKVEIGQDALATLDALPGVLLKGNISKVSAVPDSQSFFGSGVKTYTVIIDVTSGTEGVQLKPGMSATVEIITDRLKDVLKIPIQSVVADGDKRYVYVLRRNRKKLREVKVGKYNSAYIQIIDGLNEGEELLLYADAEIATDTKLRRSPLSWKKGAVEGDRAEKSGGDNGKPVVGDKKGYKKTMEPPIPVSPSEVSRVPRKKGGISDRPKGGRKQRKQR